MQATNEYNPPSQDHSLLCGELSTYCGKKPSTYSLELLLRGVVYHVRGIDTVTYGQPVHSEAFHLPGSKNDFYFLEMKSGSFFPARAYHHEVFIEEFTKLMIIFPRGLS